MRFEFATSTHIIFGPGVIGDVSSLLAERNVSRAFVITGKKNERARPLVEQLYKKGIEHILFNVSHEPTTDMALAGVQQARTFQADIVIGIGGGSVLDIGKVIAALLTNTGDLFDYLEVIGRGRSLTVPAAPSIAIPTTAGTGAEVTRNSVLTSLEHHVKVSIRSQLMLPSVAIVDPELTYSLPPSITASTGLDALTQLIEAYVSQKANPLTDGICKEGLTRAARSLQRAFEHGECAQAREDMSLASLFGGLALANSKLGAVHGIAGPLGGMLSIAHGAVCSRLLPLVIEVNVRALKSRAPASPLLAKYDEVARIMTRRSTARADDGVRWIQELCEIVDIPPLSDLGLRREHFSQIIEKSKRASSMQGNPIALMDEELQEIVERAL
ncbi:MAG: iron-containing alcohol dehydrogenase [bacterium]